MNDRAAGKTKDSNSNYMAKKLFDLGIVLKRIEVIADDEEEIGEHQALSLLILHLKHPQLRPHDVW